MEFAVLGPLVVRRAGTAVEVGPRKQRALLIHLVLRAGLTVPVDHLIDALWGEDPPPQARVTLRAYVSNLRRALHDGEDDVIVTRSSGYSLQVDPSAVDAVRFEQGVMDARGRLEAGDPQAALRALDEALGLWRGQALADLGDDVIGGERARLEELRLSAHEDRFDALLRLGRSAEAVASLEAFTASEPLRERARAQLMLGLYRSGRAPDALKVFQRFRDTLVEELGLDPSPALSQLADRILNQDRDLDLPGAPAPPQGVAPGPTHTGDQSPLIGRTHERNELQAALDRLLEGEGGLLLVAGEPGIGKTALLEELARLADAAGAAVYWGRCHETQGAPVFWPWMQVLREITAEVDDDALQALTSGRAAPVAMIVEEIARRTDTGTAVPAGDVESARFQLYDAIATFLLQTARRRPLVVLLDDLHWGDAPSLQTLAFLTALLPSAPVLVAATYRDVRADWAPELEPTLATVVREPSTEQIGLTGLHPRDVGQLADRLTSEPLSPQELDVLHARTGGNPFFVRQLSQLLRDARPNLHGAPSIPTGVRHVLSRRLGMVESEVRELLEAAAVAGADFDLRVMRDVLASKLDAVADAATRASSHGLIEPAGGRATAYRFVHALVRETIYDGISPHQRAALHLRVGDVLERTGQVPAARLAEHFWQAADLIEDDRPVQHLLAAADEALAVMGHEQAEVYLQRALELLTATGHDAATELRVRMRLAQLLISTRGWASAAIEDVAAPARRLVRETGILPEIVALWVALLSLYTARGDIVAATEIAQEMLDEGTAVGDPAALAAGHCAVAFLDLTLGREPSVALEHLQKAQEHAAAAPPEHLHTTPHIGVQAITLQAVALAYQGDREAAIGAAQRGIQVAEDIGNAFSMVNAYTSAGLVGVLLEEPAFAAEVTAAGLALSERQGFRMATHVLTTTNSWARARTGEDPAEHARAMRAALGSIAASGHGHPRAKYILFTAETFAVAGDAAAARECLQQARTHADQTGETMPVQRVLRLENTLAEMDAHG